MFSAMTDAAALYTQLNNSFQQREWASALAVAAKLIPLAPQDARLYNIAGISNLHTQHLPQAIECFRKASALEPQSLDYAVQFAKSLTAANRCGEAKIVADYASSLPSNDHRILDSLGVVFSQLGDYPAATATFSRVVSLCNNRASYRYNLATSLIANGDIEEAETQIAACLDLDPRHWPAHVTLAQLRRQTAKSNHVNRLQCLVAGLDPTMPDTHALTCLHSALFKEYEDLRNYPEAFHHLVSSKTAAGAGHRHRLDRDEAMFSALTQSFPVPITPLQGHRTNEPIFVIGMPRSGTTLVERIISSHPDVHSAGELLNFAMSVKHFSKSTSQYLIDDDVVRSAASIDPASLGELYLKSTRPMTGHKPRFIDKLPHNFLYAGFISKALPDAKIICLRRDPMDTCLSNFRQLFSIKSPFFGYSFDLLDTGRYYVLFDRLMAHWQKVMPGRILEINYDELVDSQEALSRRIIDFCDLSWDERCLRFEDNPGPVATASWVQVRSPIYRSSLKRWKKYEPQLAELKALLENSGIKIDN
jgi:tetratricopeptide (TPR) repeat protein